MTSLISMKLLNSKEPISKGNTKTVKKMNVLKVSKFRQTLDGIKKPQVVSWIFMSAVLPKAF